ncbi:MAG: hypothetical protein J1E77_04885, partial [Prevotella sp.]|nr:hypothetical protein [Prevotella sp.]
MAVISHSYFLFCCKYTNIYGNSQTFLSKLYAKGVAIQAVLPNLPLSFAPALARIRQSGEPPHRGEVGSEVTGSLNDFLMQRG